jgi:hypothetical protein
VNCCVKKEGLCTAYAPVCRRVFLHQTNQPTKLSKQTKQANQASKTSIEHVIHTIQRRFGRADNQRDRGDGVGVRGSGPGRVMVGDASPVGKQQPEHEQNRDYPGGAVDLNG